VPPPPSCDDGTLGMINFNCSCSGEKSNLILATDVASTKCDIAIADIFLVCACKGILLQLKADTLFAISASLNKTMELRRCCTTISITALHGYTRVSVATGSPLFCQLSYYVLQESKSQITTPPQIQTTDLNNIVVSTVIPSLTGVGI
jgi:hypothetical protein